MLLGLGKRCIRALQCSEIVRHLGQNLRFNTTVAAGMSHCSVCGVTVTSEGNLQQHLSGRRHSKFLEKLRTSERSVYIRGFSEDITSEALQKFLEGEVGRVSSLWISDNLTYALVEFKDVEDALKAVHMAKVTMAAGNKLVIKPRVLPAPSSSKHPPTGSGEAKPSPARLSGDSPRKKQRESGVSIDVQDILQSPELEGQLKRLSKADSIPKSVLEDHLDVTFQLLREVRQRYPHCLLVPFGSVITGLATKHSDSDLCLVPHPPATLVRLLTGTNYFSPPLLSIVEGLECKYGVAMRPPATPPSPPTNPATPLSPPTNPTIPPSLPAHPLATPIFPPTYFATPPSLPPATSSMRKELLLSCNLNRSERGATFGPLLKKLRENVQKMDGCGRVVLLPNARCPILRFRHDTTSLDFDVCIENVLGPLNTRLIKAYCDFDDRVPILLSVVKLWSRSLGFSGTKLNSYALSLMVIYFLQRCSPPVLPCLQEPQRWPRNPVWYREKLFHNQVPLELKWTAPWRVGFTAPGSLLPSSNRDSAVALLLNFFKYYAEQFDFSKHVVSVETPPSRMLTRDGAVQKILDVGREPPVGYFYKVPLVVQDPFDLEHNVSKLVNRGVLMSLRASLKNAFSVLQRELGKDSQPSILAILDELVGDEPPPPSTRQLEFTLSCIRNLLLQRGLTVTERLGELGLPETRLGLEHLVLREVVHVLTSKFVFEASSEVGSQEEEMERMREEGAGVGGMEGMGEVGGMEGMREEGGRGEEVGEMDRSGEEGAMGTGAGVMEEGEEAMDVEGVEEGGMVGGVVKRKRMLSDQELPELTQSKRCKVQPTWDVLVEPRPHASTKPHPHSYICTAYRNTWTGMRKARRQSLQRNGGLHALPSQGGSDVQDNVPQPSQVPPGEGMLGGSVSPQDGAEILQQPHPEVVSFLSDTAPVLQLRVALEPLPPDSWLQETVCLRITLLQGSVGEFYQFIALLKKGLWSGATQEQLTGTLQV